MKHLPLTLIALLSIGALPTMVTTEALAHESEKHAQAKGVNVENVRENIHVLISPEGGNVAVSTGDDGTFIIDDQLSGREAVIEKAIKDINNQDIQFILNTHFHFDHTGGNETFGERGSIIIAQDNVRKRLETDQLIPYFKKEMPAMSKHGLPVVTFSKDITLHYNGDDIHVVHVPAAHTDTDSIAHFMNANVLVAGDTVFNGIYPFIDIDNGGSINGVIDAVDVMLGMANNKTVIIPGHGKLMGKDDLKAYHDMLVDIRDQIQAAIKDGKSLKKTIKMKPTEKYDEKISLDFIDAKDFTTLVYKSLEKSAEKAD